MLKIVSTSYIQLPPPPWKQPIELFKYAGCTLAILSGTNKQFN